MAYHSAPNQEGKAHRACNGLETLFVQANVRFAAACRLQPTSVDRVQAALAHVRASHAFLQLAVCFADATLLHVMASYP